MKKTFTKLFSAAFVTAIMLIGFTANAQTTSLNNDAANVAATTTAPAGTDMKADVKADKNKKATDTKTADTKEVKNAAAPVDTVWHPQRRVWGYSFGDFYYDQHADAGGRGGETNYSGVPTYRNAFQLRRVYLGYDYEITKKFKAELLLASEPNASTGTVGATSTSTSTTTLTGVTGGTAKTTTTTTTTTSLSNGDNTVDNKMAFFIKNINLRYRDLFPGTDFVIGEMSTPTFALNEPGTNGPSTLSETVWGYRSVERTITDFHKANSYDLGASLQGTFDPATKNYGYVLMVGNNSTASLLSAANANTGFYKIFYGDIWAKFLNNHLDVDFYADYAKTAAATYLIGPQSHNMYKLFAAYVSKPLSVGVEAYTQKIPEGVTNTASKAPEDATVHGLTIWVKGAIVKDKIGFFARRDGYNPDTQFNTGDSYTVNTNYGSYTPTVKETFYTAGLDFTPAKNVHFMPNFWLVDYKDQRGSTVTGYVAPDHTLVYRFTFFYTFGK